MTLGEEQEAFARDLTRLLVFAFGKGYAVRIGEVQRTVEQQQIYIRQGRSQTLNSMHIKKCAADLYFVKDGILVYPKELGDFWEGLDPKNQWGGNWRNFKDLAHYQRTV
jgi:peptidoglycan L-alanyl-D-glutamate endopeptidase CwlK